MWYLRGSYIYPFNLICFAFIHFYDGGLPFNLHVLMLIHIPYASIALNTTVFLPCKYVFYTFVL
jgi:hypothetical protein